ncbi:uncharacterized protein H6S33_010137 [Morchella sextelata]|uniref:uncharacterized protein n=1 Tax=Morchella sextelata TaxID=1174677 RepID=UPI001D0497F7|nr:uncharacterized protein H6S33_010137 [Morchella sextelata]KAH0612085.1 hypothetical protein H6S33_010137 [Morchella sextelata]
MHSISQLVHAYMCLEYHVFIASVVSNIAKSNMHWQMFILRHVSHSSYARGKQTKEEPRPRFYQEGGYSRASSIERSSF